MQLKIAIMKELKHVGGTTCIGWLNSEEILSCGDDHQILKLSVMSRESSVLCKLPMDVSPLDMHWPTRNAGTTNMNTAKHGDVILITSADGKFHLISRSGRIERSVEAHQGACLVGRWSYDGAGFITAGEDGLLKVWSRSGMLRSTLTSCDTPIYTGAWAPDSQAVVHSTGRLLNIRSLAPSTKPIRWKAHDGLVLKVAWCPTNGLIVSGGEDCRYRVWDSLGRSLYVSGLHEFPITALAWSPSGDVFTIGGYNTLRICDFTGWSQSLEKPESGSLYQISWSSDGTQMAAACANGHILFAHLVGKRFDWKEYSAVLTGRKTLTVQDLNNESKEQLDFPDRVIQVALSYNHLVVATPTQCHIYSTNNWNTPVIFDLKEGAVCMLLVSEKYIAVIERGSVSIYNLQGRLTSTPRWQGMHPEGLSRATVSLCPDLIVVRDHLDHRVIHSFELSTSGNRTNTETGTQLQHSLAIAELALSQASTAVDRQLALIDINRDLHLVAVRDFGPKQFIKLGSQMQSMQWNTDADMLAVIQDTHLLVWYCPTASAHNPRLLRLAALERDAAELGRSPRVHSFQDSMVNVRRSDGSLITILISPYVLVLHQHVMGNKWDSALKLCRTLQDEVLWAALAALATHAKMLDTAEEAFAAIQQHDKVAFIQHIKLLPNRAQQMAGASLLNGSTTQAESTLLHSGLLYQAISNNLNLYLWNRALDLALKHKSHIDTVLYLRKQYLDDLEKVEINPKFLQIKDSIEINEEAVKQKIQIELRKT